MQLEAQVIEPVKIAGRENSVMDRLIRETTKMFNTLDENEQDFIISILEHYISLCVIHQMGLCEFSDNIFPDIDCDALP